MKTLRLIWSPALAATAAALGLPAGTALAYTVPYSTPPGIILVDVSKVPLSESIPQFLWRRLGDGEGNALYTYDGDQSDSSSCYDDCAKEFPPFVADARARAFGEWSIIDRANHVRQWAYQGKPLYRYSGTDPVGEPAASRFIAREDPAWSDPASKFYSPKRGWRRAAYTPEKAFAMPPDIELDFLAIANGFGFVDAASHMTLYAAPVSHKLSAEWRPMRASALALPIGDFSIVRTRDDGTRQWTYKGEALYTYAGDYAPTEVTGIFTSDKSVQAALASQDFTPPGILIGHYPGRGALMTTTTGQSLYYVARYHTQYGGREAPRGYFVTYNDAKAQGAQGCQGDCTKTWKPVIAPENAQPSGFWEVIARPDGTKQWVFKGSPVYTFIGDKHPGDVEGNNRHVIVYGGSKGQILYADAGGDPHDPQPLLGSITMQIAQEPLRDDSASGVGARAEKGATPAGGGNKPGVGTEPSAASQAVRRSFSDYGAGLYWHTVGLF
jgi:predicted lipoprotein with Yx(FWY)xxD motif